MDRGSRTGGLKQNGLFSIHHYTPFRPNWDIAIVGVSHILGTTRPQRSMLVSNHPQSSFL
jgi:hypothetical protein